MHTVAIESIEADPANPRALKTYARITFADGEQCVCDPRAVEDMTTGCEGFTVVEVQMTEAEFDALPEFNG